MIFKVDGEFMMFLVRGHHELNDVKVKAYFETDSVEMATQDECKFTWSKSWFIRTYS